MVVNAPNRYAVLLLGGLVASMSAHAGLDRFWRTQKTPPELSSASQCESLSKEQQAQLIAAYHAAQDEQTKADLKKRMSWFCQLSADEQQRMRLAWQNMSTRERSLVKKKLESTTDPDKRAQIRQDILDKYSPATIE